MQPHPIPQNVTSFQFHLVGDMTLKQFVYLATGSAIAYFLFVFLASLYPIIAWPLIIIFAGAGLAFAFLPINSRPLDYWLGAFLKAIYSPTKRIWQKNGKSFKDEALFNSRFLAYTAGFSQTPVEQPKVTPVVNQLPQPPSQMPTPDDLKKTVDLAKEAQNLQMKIIQTERTLGQIKQASQTPGQIPIDYSEQVNKILADLQSLMAQASQIRTRIDAVTNIPPVTAKAKVKVVIPTKPKQTQLALTTFPNVISGIIKDNVGNYLEGAVAVIYDKEGLPVRALKTNKLGQFSGSTPLPNGVYTLELEKDNYNFDVLQIELTGGVLPPLMIASK